MNTATIAFLAIAAIIIIAIIGMYNGLIRVKNQIDNAQGGIDAQLKKRFDLIPNLVETVKQFASHEKDLLENIVALRNSGLKQNLSDTEKASVDQKLSGALSGLMVQVENYPDLKSNENFLNLQRNLNEVESQLSAARRSFNASVTDYNNGIESFPKNIIAAMMGLKRRDVFIIAESEKANANVKNLFNS
ncbi:MAG: LemA family protein [Bacteroidetes bacterium]|nr:LemA family protein [Bacteroidota bacterium]